MRYSWQWMNKRNMIIMTAMKIMQCQYISNEFNHIKHVERISFRLQYMIEVCNLLNANCQQELRWHKLVGSEVSVFGCMTKQICSRLNKLASAAATTTTTTTSNLIRISLYSIISVYSSENTVVWLICGFYLCWAVQCSHHCHTM